MKHIKIANKKVGLKYPPFLIAEAGINHKGNLKRALKMIEVAKKAGVDAVKFQTFKADEFISNKKKNYRYFSKGKWVNESMYDMFKRYELSEDCWYKIKKKCKDEKIIFLSTPQNYSDLKILLKVGVPAIKVGSDDFNNTPLIKKYAKTKLPLILSSGMANIKEIKQTLKEVHYKKYPVILMLCVSQYPTAPKDVNLLRLNNLKKLFPNLVLGFSDHTRGPLASSIAVSLGAKCVEKHFTLDNNDNGPDHWFSENPEGLRIWSNSIRTAYKMLGKSVIKPTKGEEDMRIIARRSIVAYRNIKPGIRINEKDLCFKRPGNGLPPSKINEIIGLRAKIFIPKDKQIRKNLLHNG